MGFAGLERLCSDVLSKFFKRKRGRTVAAPGHLPAIGLRKGLHARHELLELCSVAHRRVAGHVDRDLQHLLVLHIDVPPVVEADEKTFRGRQSDEVARLRNLDGNDVFAVFVFVRKADDGEWREVLSLGAWGTVDDVYHDAFGLFPGLVVLLGLGTKNKGDCPRNNDSDQTKDFAHGFLLQIGTILNTTVIFTMTPIFSDN